MRNLEPGSLAVFDAEGHLLACSGSLRRLLGEGWQTELEGAARQLDLQRSGSNRARLELGGEAIPVEVERVDPLVLMRLAREEADEGAGQRFKALSRLAEGMSHDARNPLNALSIHVGLLATKLGKADPALAVQADRHLRAIREQVGRVEAILRRFMRFAGSSEPATARVDLGELVQQAVESLGHDAKRQGVALASDLGERATVEADCARLAEAIIDLVMQGIDEGRRGGRLSVSLQRCQQEAVLQLNGESAGEPELPSGEQLLWLASRVIEHHHGRLTLRKEGARREIEVRLPLAPQP